MSNVGGAASNA